MSTSIAGIPIPGSAMARAAAALVISTEPEILYRHSMRVYLFAALIGEHRGIAYDPELLFVTALFHDVGLTALYRDSQERFEIDGANAVHRFLSAYRVPQRDVAEAWHAVALHTTFGIHVGMPAVPTLIAAGVETDLLGFHFDEIDRVTRETVLRAFPRGTGFKELIIETFAQGMTRRPATTFGTVNADVLERCDSNYRRKNFCGLILGANWEQ
jgi:hypothetical protein